MKKYSWFLLMAFVAFACQDQNDAVAPSDDAASRIAGATPGAYVNSFSSSTDGQTFTITIDQSAAQDISHINFKFTSCDGVALGLENITGFTANGDDMMGKLGSVEGRGNSCYGVFTDPFVKLDQGFSTSTVVLVITLDTPASGGSFLIKSATNCFGLDDPNYAFSHDCTPVVECSQEETAWATGPRYVSRGNWATYTPYQDGSVNVYAGQNMHAGTATMSAVSGGMVTITISLNAGWSLQNVSNPVKIQNYNTAPSGNPSPGRFASKGTSLTVSVPADNFYGIHVDVQKAVQCPN
jgi:hypothetical protein